MARVSLSWDAAYEFACHSAACRPPTSGGTGGSSPKGGGVSVPAKSSPHYQTRSASVMPLSEAEGIALVQSNDATGRRILAKGQTVADGAPVGVRANLNVKKSTGVTVQTVHAGTEAQLKRGTGMFGGEAIGYTVAATLRDVNFSVNQAARHKIATKQSNKFPMASVDGRFKAADGPDKFDGIEVRFNPMTSHLFTDPDGRAVKSASEATVVGSSVFVRGVITYYSPENMPKPVGGVPSNAHA